MNGRQMKMKKKKRHQFSSEAALTGMYKRNES